MSDMLAMVDLMATRTLAQAEPDDPLSLRAVHHVGLTLSASDPAIGEGVSLTDLRAQFDDTMRALGVRVTDREANDAESAESAPRSASIAVRVEVLQAGGEAALLSFRRAAERLNAMRSVRPMRHMEVHESVIAWKGIELGSNMDSTFASGAAAALAALLQQFESDFRRANTTGA